RQSSWVVNALTIGKLLPLGIFLAAGLFFVDWSRLSPLPALTAGQAASAGLLLIFVFGGFDVLCVPAGEATEPRRQVPFAFIMTIAAVTLIMTLAQIVTITNLADVTKSTTPM